MVDTFRAPRTRTKTMKTKKFYCPTCSYNGRHPQWEATWSVLSTDTDCVVKPIWECRCCHRVEPRIVRAKRSNGANFLRDSVDGAQ